jgi:hypothetical protein
VPNVQVWSVLALSVTIAKLAAEVILKKSFRLGAALGSPDELIFPPDVNPPSDVIGCKFAAIFIFPYSY